METAILTLWIVGGAIAVLFERSARRADYLACAKRLDTAHKELQREAAERGKLSRRLAQAETKITKLVRGQH